MLIVMNELEVLGLGNVPIEPDGLKAPEIVARILEVVLETVIIAGRGNAVLD